MTSPQDPALDDLASGLAEELGEVSVSIEGETTRYARGSSTFARTAAGVMEILLPTDIAEAALRTPDTAAIPGERDWIRFSPARDEPHVVDRAEAWFRTAWRHAGSR